MSGLPSFRQRYQAGRLPAPGGGDSDGARCAELYRDRLPQALLEEWRATGLGGVDQGFLWLTDPAAFAGVLSLWTLAEPALAFGRTAFGDLFLWSGDAVHGLFIHDGAVTRLTDSLEGFFELSLCDDAFLDEALHRPLFEEALEFLGPPAADEMYTFVPALALGGEESLQYLRKVKMREQLLLLSRLHHQGPP